MSHYILPDKCVGCQLCAKKCPTNCIAGEPKGIFVIYPQLCIDCGVCASYCPVEGCIMDHHGVPRNRINPKNRPYAVVIEENCTGCEECVGACPFDCLEMVLHDGYYHRVSANVRAKDCVGCKLCEDVCAQKGAIRVVWPDGSYCEAVGVSIDGPFRRETLPM